METRNSLCGLISGRLGWLITQPCAPLWTRVKARLKMPTWLAGLAAAGMCVASANADTSSIVFVNETKVGNQQDVVVGMDFIVNRTVTVTEMGIFDSDSDVEAFAPGNTLTVGIFRLSGPSGPLVTGTLIASSMATFDNTCPGTLNGFSRFKSVTPFDLVPGDYSIVASGFDSSGSFGSVGNDQLGNNSFGGISTSFDDLSVALTVVNGGG